MLFICTCSQDSTTDILLPHLQESMVFRFNIDKYEDYSWDFSRGGFIITNNKNQRIIDSQTISSFYLRKPIYFNGIDIPKSGCLENWRREETDALFKDFYRACESSGLTAVVRCRSGKYGKLRQLLVAEKYFRVANWHMFHGMRPSDLNEGRWVVKTLTGTSVGDGKMLFVREVNPMALDLSYPWFLQEKIDGEDEVTVVYVCGRIFSYCFPRSAIEDSEDVRKVSIEDPSKWKPCKLSESECLSICGFMKETGYRFGRFDFIRKSGELWFLELNPNGQWAWLDEDNKDGLISSIADAIIVEDLRHQELLANKC